jgi:hypothetical protein
LTACNLQESRVDIDVCSFDYIHLGTAIKAQCSHIIITNDKQVALRAKGIKVIRLESEQP